MDKYKIIRYFQECGKDSKIIKENLTLEEAQAHCNNPKTSGAGWFDGYISYTPCQYRGISKLLNVLSNERN